MKRFAIVLFVALTSVVVMAFKKSSDYLDARRNGAAAQLRICVVGDDGGAVSNASVRVFMGMNFRPKGHWIEGKSDENGVFVAQGKTCGDEIEIYASKSGFYDSVRKISFASIGVEREVEDGKWLPYGATETLRLRLIGNQKPLVKGGFGMGRDVPRTNVWLGVDMNLKDFVKPYGRGMVGDFEIMVEWDGRPPSHSGHCMAAIRFIDRMAGGYYAPKVMESEYPYVYNANENGRYDIRQLQIAGRERMRQTVQVSFGKDSALVTRTRCIVDENGGLKSANYGLITEVGIMRT